jgi:ABC-type Fe3+ transport system substrate-binding protein
MDNKKREWRQAMIVRALRTAAAFAGLAALAALPLAAADLPKATQKILQDTKLDPALLNGLDDELKMPPEWIEGAKKEKVLRIGGTWDPAQFDAFSRPFRERYPFVSLRYSRGTRFDRVTKPLVAFKSGRVTIDVITGIGAEYTLFKDAGAIENLSAIPNRKNVPPHMQQKDGWWIGQRLRYWCMSYNNQRVAKNDLPKTWDDLLEKPALRNGNIGMGNRPNLWLLPMWEDKGETWIKNFSERLFAVDKPQLRNEGMNALLELAIAGEFNISLPSAEYRTQQLRDKGAPLGWHCPEPVPLTISELIVMKGGNKNAAFLFVNWFLSKEGQIAQFAADLAPPVHKDLQTREFLAFPDEILGRPVAFLDPEVLERDLDKMLKIWEPLWYSGMGLKLQVVSTMLTKVEKGGRSIAFDANGVPQTARISPDNTRIAIASEPAEPSELKVGLSCEITYAGDNQNAIRVECK